VFTFTAPAVAYTSSAVTQATTAAVSAGSTNQHILTLAVTIGGVAAPNVNLTQVTANTNGTTNTADLSNARLYFGGTSNTFSTATQYGSTVANPNGTFVFNGSQSLGPGTYYFFLAYDISGSAAAPRVVDGEITALAINGAAATPTPTTPAPAGSRPIVAPFPGGTYTIDNTQSTTYPSGTNFKNFTDAVNSLNTLGAPTSTVTFNVIAGQTFTELETTGSGALTNGNGRVPVIINPGGTSASAQIIFQKSGIGANPKLSVTTTTGASTFDAGIALAGGDWFTFDGIDIAQATTPSASDFLEFGYALFRGTGTSTTTDNGCQNNTIKNSTITLARDIAGTSNTTSVGIYGALTASGTGTTAGGTITTVSSFNGTNSNNTFTNNTITGAYRGVFLNGFVSSTASLLDAGNNVGGTAGATGVGNKIRNFGTHGISAVAQAAVLLNNNNISNAAQTAPVISAAVYGIQLGSGSIHSITASNDTITLVQATNNGLYGINNSSSGVNGNAITFTNNVINLTVNSATVANSSTIGGVYNSASSGTIAMNSNKVALNINQSSTFIVSASTYGVYNTGTAVGSIALNSNDVTVSEAISGTANASNTVYGVYNTGGTGTTFAANGTTFTFTDNLTAAGNHSGSVYGVYLAISSSNPVTGTGSVSNTIFSWERTGTGAGNHTGGTIAAIYNSSSYFNGTLTFNNNVWGPSASTAIIASNASNLYLIYDNYGSNTAAVISNNTLQNLTLYGPSATAYGYYGNSFPSSIGSRTYTNNTFTTIDLSNLSNPANSAQTPATGAFYGLYHTTFSAVLTATGNQINNILVGSGALHGIYATSSDVTSTFNNNNVNTLLAYGGTALMSGLYLTGGVSQVQGNTVQLLIPQGSGAAYGINTSSLGTISGNTITDITSTSLTATAGVYGLNVTGAATSVTGNTITTITTVGTNPAYGVASAAASTSANTISGVYSASTTVGATTTPGTGNVYGLFLNGSAGTSNAFGHSISDIAANNGTVYGIYVANTSSNVTNVYKNKVYGLGLTGSPTGIIYGAFANVTSATATANIYNNLIGLNGLTVTDLAGTGSNAAYAATDANALTGIGVGGTAAGTVNISFNTVDLQGGGGTTFGSSALYISSATPVVNLRSNIFQNLTSPGSTSGAAVAYRRSAAPTATNTPAATNNQNLYYAGTPGAANLLYAEGTGTLANQQQTLAQFKAYFLGTPCTTREQSSVSPLSTALTYQSYDGSDPLFLHVAPGSSTQIESSGMAVAGITDDYDGNTRSATPDMGADEGSFTPIDVTGPTITYTPLTNTPSTGSRTLTVGITDASGVNITGANQPTLYFRKGTTGAYATATGTITGSGNSVSVTFTLNQPGLVAGDVVQYYVAAQDQLGNGGANPPSNCPNQYTILPTLSGNVYVGTTACNGNTPTYATLTAFAAAYNGGGFGISGTVNVLLTDATYTGETYPITFNNNPFSTATDNVVIKPCTGVSPVFTNTTATPTVVLNGTTYLTLDGSNAGTSSRDWTLTTTNTGTAEPIVRVQSGTAPAANVVVKNLNITGQAPTTTRWGIRLLNTASTGASNITLSNNSITKVQEGIAVNGNSTTVRDAGVVVSNNLVGATGTGNGFGGGTAVGISATNQTGISITGNTVRNANVSTATLLGIDLNNNVANATVSNNTVLDLLTSGSSGSGSPLAGIRLNTNTTGAVVNANLISNVVTSATGGYGGYGLYVNTGTASANLRISNNVISGVNGSNFSGFTNSSTAGIYLNSTQSGITLAFNTVNLSGASTYSSAVNTAALAVESGSTGLTVVNNILANSITGAISGSLPYSLFSNAPASAYTLINNNDYYSYGAQAPASGVQVSIGGTAYTTLATVRTATGQDAASLSVDPQFTSSTDLTPLSTALNNKGVPVAGITTDFTGATRNATTPDMGAYEFTPPANDAGLVSIDTPVSPFAAGNQSITVTVSSTGTTALTSVQLQYVYTPNGGTAQPAVIQTFPVTLAAGTTPTPTQQVTFSTPLSVTGTGGNLVVTVLQSNGGPDGNIANNTITRSLVPALCGNYNIGTAGAFPTLDAAVAALNSAGATCAVTFTLTDATYAATSGITINQYPGSSSTNTLTIKPGTGATPALTTTTGASFLLKLNGADYVTIDGSNNGTTSRNLTLTSLNTGTSAVVWVSSLGTGTAANNSPATNNVIKNTTIVGGSVSSTTSFGIYAAGTTISASGTGSGNNNLVIQNNAVSKAYEGIYARGGTAAASDYLTGLQITDNSIGAALASAANTVTLRGVDVQNATALVNRNVIFGMQASGSISIAAIELGQNTGGSTVSRNRIYSLRQSSTSGYGVYGVNISTSTGTDGIEISNNMIADLLNSSQTDGVGTFNPFGIRITGGNGHKVYYNTISMAGTVLSGATTSTSYTIALGITGGSVDLRNNIIRNSIAAAGSTGKSYGLYASSASYLTTSDNNDYYVSGTNGVLGYVNGDVTTLAALKAATTKDANSLNVAPVFTTTPTDAGDLHLDPNSNSGLNNKGTAVSVTGDYDNETRSATRPDIGADEFSISGTDIAVTAFTGVPAPLVAGSYPVSVTVTNNGSVAVSSVVVSYTLNGSTTNLGTQTVSLAPGASVSISLGSLTFVAGDNTLTANVTNPNGTPEAAPADLTDNALTQVFSTALCGTYAVGTGGDYTTLDLAIAALNRGGATCSVTFNLTDATYPASSGMTINQFPGNSSSVRLTIKPAAGASPVLTTTASASFLFNLNGADYVTIDGSNNGSTSRDLTLTLANTAGGSTILVGSLGTGLGATNNTFKNLNINGGSSTAGFGISAGAGAGSPGADNDNMTISNNRILRSYNGIYVGGSAVTSAGGADGLVISNNVIGPKTAGTDNLSGTGMFLANLVSPVISGDTIRNIITTSGNATGVVFNLSTGGTFSNNTIIGVGGTNDVYGLKLGSVTGVVVDRNQIRNIAAGATGGWGGHGIDVSNAAASNTTLSNNFVANITGSSWSNLNSTSNAGNTGIRLLGTTGGVNVYFNSVSLTENTTDTGSRVSAAFYAEGGTTGLDVRNNIFYNAWTNAGSSKSYAFASAAPASAYTTVNYNDYFVGGSQGVLGLGGSTDLATLTDIRTYTTQDAQSISADPQFTSATDLHINRLYSAVNNLGTPIAGITQDIDGETRSATAPDLGGDEYAPYTGNVGITALVQPAATNCYGGTRPVQVAITNFTGVPTDFPIAVTVTVTGPGGTQTITGTTTRVIPANDSIQYTVGNYVVNGSGSYTFNATTNFLNDTNTSNDALSPAVTVSVSVPDAITITATPTAAGTTGVCSGDLVTLTANSTTMYTYTWTSTTGGVLNTTSGPTVTANPTQNATYTVTGVSGACTITQTFNVVVNPLPVVTLSATPATACVNNTVQLSAVNPADLASLRITEVLLNRGGTGSNTTYPSYAPGADIVEISNLSTNTVDAGGLVVQAYTGSALDRTFTVPANTLLPSNGVLLIHFGSGTDSPSNFYFNQGGSNDTYFSSSTVGFVIKQAGTNGAVIDAVAANGYAFPASSGVSASDFTGTVPSSSGFAGLIRTAADDTNDASDFTVASATLRQTIGTYNGSYTAITSSYSYSYASPNGGTFSSNTAQNPTFTATTAGSYPITVTATNTATGCSKAYSVTVTVTNTTTWTGAATVAANRTDWFNAGNWTNCVPDANISAIIPTGLTNYPILTTGTAVANNLTVQGTAVVSITNAAATLDLKGNLTTAGISSINATAGTMTFTGTTAQTIGSGQFFNMTLNGAVAKVLAGDIRVGNNLDLTNGMLNSNGFEVRLNSTAGNFVGAGLNHYVMTNGSTGRVRFDNVGTGGRASVTFPIGTTDYTPATLTNTGTLDFFTGTVADGISRQGNAVTTHVVGKTWDISEGVAGGSNSTLSLQWNAADELSGFDRSNSSIAHYENNAWNLACYNCFDAATGTNPYVQERTGITSFSPFGVEDGARPLPVELTRFTAQREGLDAVLDWATASEKNNLGFDVQVSTDGRTFRALGFVAGAGSSSSPRSYRFLDTEKNKAGVRYYRLRQVDTDGTENFSPVRTVAFDNSASLATSLTASPNPFTTELTLTVAATKADAAAQLTVTDAAGRTVLEQKLSIAAGTTEVSLRSLDKLPAGMYLLHLPLDGKLQHVKVVKK